LQLIETIKSSFDHLMAIQVCWLEQVKVVS
jgi:hypothetical protein